MIVKGDILYSKNKDQIEVVEKGYLIIEDGIVQGVYNKLAPKHEGGKIVDYEGKLIIPSFVDLHLHAPQYANCGLGTDVELLVWLEKYTYPEEEKFKDEVYRKAIYKELIRNLWKGGSLRSVIFGSLYREATEDLMDMLIESGLSAYVGKVNMDRNCPDSYRETTLESLEDTEAFIIKYEGKSDLVKPIITPRFVPHCTAESMAGQGQLAEKYGVPVQSHINESLSEIEWVKELHPESKAYSHVYDEYGLFGSPTKTIMAHVIFNEEAELELMDDRQIYPVHCPESNANIMSGIMDAKRLLERGLPVSLGSDISGGHHLYMPFQIVLAIQLSKMRARMEDDLSKVLTFSEAFYMATKSGGSFFGKVGSFEPGYEGDFLVVDTDKILTKGEVRNPLERLQKFIYIGNQKAIKERYLRGVRLEKPFK
ncbi:guanine deaminase [endosymbiont 'TC1' of Trimyema compressum]|uniref:amidohydrolase family protein n=1 Tax=endosymbiont 'TC1' of Trimyema compressum TaxID=243899 RepID=UPI0007F1015F|nr:amidohydrolase family protein [endosymbiont 'TC1' of Trimyema compressum]AMP20086.1 guanine deaminase [endosymbiont 'TC1' of Trimyema compressum]